MALTRRLLHGARLPAGNGMVVQNAKGAVVAARRLGYPVVLTPFAGRHSPIGCRNLHNEADVHDAFPDAARDSLSGRVIVARPAAGTVYRILVVGDRVAAVAERVPKHSTVQGQTGEADLGTLATSADQTKAVLSTRDLTLDDGVAESRVIPLALTGSRGSGGTTIDRTDEIHPRTAAIACHAAQVVGLAVAEDATLLARLDAAFFQVAEAHDGLLVKVYDPTVLSREGLREGLRRDGLDIERLEAGTAFAGARRAIRSGGWPRCASSWPRRPQPGGRCGWSWTGWASPSWRWRCGNRSSWPTWSRPPRWWWRRGWSSRRWRTGRGRTRSGGCWRHCGASFAIAGAACC